MKGKNKNLKSYSLENAEDAKIVSEEIKGTTKSASSSLPKIEAPTHKTVSPLLSDSIDVMDHAVGEQQIVTPPATASHDSFKVSSDLFSGSTTSKIESNVTPNQSTSATSQPFTGPDAPEQVFMPAIPTGQGNNASSESKQEPISDSIQTSAKGLADTVTDLYKNIVPEVTHSKTKITDGDIKTVRTFEKSGDLLPGIADDLVLNNQENKKKFTERAKKDAEMLKGPMERSIAKFLNEKKMESSPYVELILVVVAICFTQFFLIKEITQSNKNLLSRIYEKIDSFKKSESDIPLKKEEVPFVKTEEVKS